MTFSTELKADAPAVTPANTNSAPSSVEDQKMYKRLSLQELMNVEVTSVAKHAEKLSDTPSAIQVITADDIRRSGASSIPEALRLADNLQVAQKNSHDWGISARGFNTDLANKLLVLIDGRTVYTPLFSGVFWGVQDYLLEDIDRIEVISGPGGTLWGANAVNGVINIITKSAKDTQGLYLNAGGGSELRDFAGVRYGTTLSTNVYLRVYGKYFDRDSEIFPSGTSANDSWRKGQGGFRLDAEPSSQNTFTLQGDYYNGDENSPTGGDAKIAGGNLLSRWTHTYSEDSDISLQMYYDRTHFIDPVVATAFAPAGNLTDNLDTYDVDFQHRFHLGDRNSIVWGTGYRFTHDSVHAAPSLTFLPPQLDRHLFSGFVQDEIKLFENLSLTLGSKLEHNDYTGFEVEPSARLQWRVAPDHTLWAAVSRAVRTPSRIDHDLFEPTRLPAPLPQSFLSGGNAFESETLIAYELGYRAAIGSKVSGSISTYYNQYDNVRSLSFTPGTVLPLYFANNLEGPTYGFELSVNYQVLDGWRLRAGYNLLKEQLHIKPGQIDLNNALNETADPQQQVSLRSSWDLPHDFEFDTGLRWVDTLYINNGGVPASVPSYFELEARLGWHPTKNIEVSVVGQNLLHDQHPEFGAPGLTRVEIQRNIYGAVTFRW